MVRPTVPGIERLQNSSSIWLVQRRPLLEAGANTALPRTSCVKRYLGALTAGDCIVYWLSGARAGVYALGQIAAGRPSPLRTPEEATAPSRRPAEIPLDLFVDLRDRPVLRSQLELDTRFAAESIIRQPFGANPHRVSVPAFETILEHLV